MKPIVRKEITKTDLKKWATTPIMSREKYEDGLVIETIELHDENGVSVKDKKGFIVASKERYHLEKVSDGRYQLIGVEDGV